jgi:formate hydrogenlyase subunit 3/multisubunit Na+/H+ antiporter MnhD subunit
MSIFLVLILIILPISLGAILILFSNRLRSQMAFNLFVLNMLVMIASALATSFSASPLRFCLTWLPSAGEMCLNFDKFSLVLVLLLSFSLLLVIIINHRQNPTSSSQQLGVALISISAANVAFLTEHFLLRYAALEAAGLCVVGASLSLSNAGRKTWDNTKLVFLNFRLGDIGLLIAIFLFYAISGTFNISQNFNLTAQLPHTIRVVLSVGLLSAVWIKIAIWPLGFWADLCSSLPTAMRTWFVDLLMPSLGAYLLYRTSPLLLSSSSISGWVISIGCTAALIKVFFTPTNNDGPILNRNPLFFSSICLVILASLADKNILWAFMVFWMLARLIFLLISLGQGLEPTPQETQYPLLYLTSQLLLMGFSLIALWQAALPKSVSPIFIVVLWTAWWMQLIHILKFNFSWKNKAQTRTSKENVKGFLLNALSGLSLVGICTAALSAAIYFLSSLVKGKGIWIIPNQTFFPYFPILSLNFWGSLIFAIIVIFILADKPTGLKKYAKNLVNSIRLRKQSSLAKEIGSKSDPLDLTAYISSFLMAAGTYVYKTFEHGSTSNFSMFFMTGAAYIYKNIEHGSVEKLVKEIQKVFNFLFAKVEKFTSADLWVYALRSVIGSSRKVQRMHPGLLRVNLVWLLIFIIVLVLIAVNPNIGSIFSTG